MKKDLTGERFGRLEVIEFSHTKKDGKKLRYFWKCKCDCGTITEKRSDGLKDGQIQSCGCLSRQRLDEGRIAKRSDLVGKVFGDFIVIERVGSNHFGNSVWKCVCSQCKIEKVLTGQYLVTTSKKPKSCGCVRRTEIKERKVISQKIELQGILRKQYPKECRVFDHIKTRCNNNKSPDYKDYGGRGINLCDEWSTRFGLTNFIEDMGKCPDGMSIERINNNGPYCKDNCKWATPKEQGNNKRNNVLITYNEETLNVSQWAEKIGMDSETLRFRINRWNDVERALTTPLRKLNSRRL